MTDDVRRTIEESKKKIQAVAKKQIHAGGPSEPVARKSPGGRRLAELRKRKQQQD